MNQCLHSNIDRCFYLYNKNIVDPDLSDVGLHSLPLVLFIGHYA